MPTLASDLRNKLERVVIDARDAAETGARAALEALAVQHHEPYPHMKPGDRQLRTHLRARARQLGDRQDTSGRLAIDHLARECAYEYWHRMLFARFLAENNLLIEPEDHMAISLGEAEELAKEEGVDVWVYASRCAQDMLPQIFRPDDPLLKVSFATEHRIKLEKLLALLPTGVFTASDALGWVYQFWQSKRKDEVNRSEVKIGADEIAAVTQLFTEPYMVEFLLHNTLGAWWAARKAEGEKGRAGDGEKNLFADCQTEVDCRRLLALPGVTWDYLRFIPENDGATSSNLKSEIQDPKSSWRPAAGTFDGWPKSAAELRVLDPCCGSGHFLVAALHHLVPIRMAEEGLSAAEAVDAVLRDNLHGLEIDERCCQITAFALALAAWTYPDAGGYRELPTLNLAHTGTSVGGTREQWMKILEGHGNLEFRFFFGQLYDLFRKAPTLGSLINPHRFLGSGMLDKQGMETLLRHLQTAIVEDPNATPEKHELGIAAQGLAKAAELLAGRYTLVITNVPYLGRGKQDEILKEHLETQYPLGKADLATAFVLRCLEFCDKSGSAALVTPQNWLFLTTYTKLRQMLLDNREWNIVARLGEHAFESSAAGGAFVALFVLTATTPDEPHILGGIDVSGSNRPKEKAALLHAEQAAGISLVRQGEQLRNPDARILLVGRSDLPLLREYADSFLGLGTGDFPHYARCFWEMASIPIEWALYQCSVYSTELYGGREYVLAWDNSIERVRGMGDAERQQIHNQDQSGQQAWGKQGVAVALMRDLKVTLYTGEKYEKALTVLVPKKPAYLPSIWAFCTSGELNGEVRKLDQKVIAANATIAKIPFDITHWQKVAAQKYPNGLPEPESDDPTQWLFHGRPEASTAPLQVAVARLLGYRWPAELDDTMRLSQRARDLVRQCDQLHQFADNDGIVCIPAVRGEEPAGQRLLALLDACHIEPKVDLDDWLCNDFFEKHCKLFQDRPFVWHIWDGRKRDGFHALVNYHKLCEGDGKGRRLLESLTYAYLGDWTARQRDGVKRGEGGAEDRLAAALELQKRLEAILAGEPPFDIFVRWKPLAEQPIGWEPDINDGVRMNIRPFLASDLPGGKKGAGILRAKPNIKWTKDRGKEPKRPIREFPWFWNWDGTPNYGGGPLAEFTGERHNECHYTTEFKRQARQRAEGEKSS